MPTMSTYPDKPHKEQQHIIGEEHKDRLGDLWDYVEFTAGTYKKGQVLRDQSGGSFISGGVGTLTADAAKGTNVLQDTGEFASKDLRGAIGVIVEGTGEGQSFQVIANDDNELQIRVMGSTEKGRGWITALDTTSQYRLRVPGRVESAAANEYNTRGVCQYDEFTVPSGEFRYGYVRKTGLDDGLIDADGESIKGNGLVIPAANGLIIGVPATLTVATLSQVIGHCLLGDIAGTTDVTVPIDFRIQRTSRSHRRPRLREEPKLTVE